MYLRGWFGILYYKTNRFSSWHPDVRFFLLILLRYHEQVLKVAILAEKYATDYEWYVDTILSLIRVAGDYVSEEVRLSNVTNEIIYFE